MSRHITPSSRCPVCRRHIARARSAVRPKSGTTLVSTKNTAGWVPYSVLSAVDWGSTGRANSGMAAPAPWRAREIRPRSVCTIA